MESEPSLDEGLIVIRKFLDDFFGNKFRQSRQHVEPLADKSMYHAMCTVYHSVLISFFTMEKVND